MKKRVKTTFQSLVAPLSSIASLITASKCLSLYNVKTLLNFIKFHFSRLLPWIFPFSKSCEPTYPVPYSGALASIIASSPSNRCKVLKSITGPNPSIGKTSFSPFCDFAFFSSHSTLTLSIHLLQAPNSIPFFLNTC